MSLSVIYSKRRVLKSCIKQTEVKKTELIPVGTIIQFAGAMPIDKWLLCDGSEVLISEYNELYQVLGGSSSPFGVTSTHFNLPDFRGRVAVGSTNNTAYHNFQLANTGGEEMHVLTSSELPAHCHDYSLYVNNNTNNGVARFGSAKATTSQDSSIHTTSFTGDNKAHENMPPYLSINYLIKY